MPLWHTVLRVCGVVSYCALLDPKPNYTYDLGVGMISAWEYSWEAEDAHLDYNSIILVCMGYCVCSLLQ